MASAGFCSIEPTQRAAGRDDGDEGPSERRIVGEPLDRGVPLRQQPLDTCVNERGCRRAIDHVAQLDLPHGRHEAAG